MEGNYKYKVKEKLDVGENFSDFYVINLRKKTRYLLKNFFYLFKL